MLSLFASPYGWTQHTGFNCYGGHGGTPVSSPDNPIGSRSVQQCGEACASAAGCAAFTMPTGVTNGSCWLRKNIALAACVEHDAFDTYDGAPSPPTPCGEWEFHPLTNCYSGHGGTPLEPSDVPLGSKSLSECQAACGDAPTCRAVVRPAGSGEQGDCFLRSAVTLEQCLASSTYDTYMRVGPFPPSPPAPPPAPCCHGYVNNFDTRDNAYGVKLPTGDVRNRSFALLIADYGLATAATSGQCCQTEVADMMRQKRKELEAQGKKLLFVGGSGDNFYWSTPERLEL